MIKYLIISLTLVSSLSAYAATTNDNQVAKIEQLQAQTLVLKAQAEKAQAQAELAKATGNTSTSKTSETTQTEATTLAGVYGNSSHWVAMIQSDGITYPLSIGDQVPKTALSIKSITSNSVKLSNGKTLKV